MNNIKLMIVLHAYQPPYPIQEQKVVHRIIENCYRPIMENLTEFDNIKLLLNISASLTEILLEEAPEILELLREHAKLGKIEFLETGAYHPIFPFISTDHAEFQIKMNNKINSAAFGPVYSPKGFWPPELAVNEDVLHLFSKLGYEYAIVPENSFLQKKEGIAYLLENGRKFALLNRDRNLSNAIAFNSYNQNVDHARSNFLKTQKSSDQPLIIAMDLETFGEHIPGYWKFLFNFLSQSNIQTINSEHISNYPIWYNVKNLVSSSWSTEDHDISNDIAYPLWDHPSNAIHAIQHSHMSFIEDIIENEIGMDALSEVELKLYLQSAHSCQFWWADRKNNRWSPPMIRRGFNLQRSVIKSVKKDENFSNKLQQRLERMLQQE